MVRKERRIGRCSPAKEPRAKGESESLMQAMDSQLTQPNNLSGAQQPNAPAVEIYACWNKIGVYGNSSCNELPQFVHCRNCPVYSHAGAQLLNRELPDGYRRGWEGQFCRGKKGGKPRQNSGLLFLRRRGGPGP